MPQAQVEGTLGFLPRLEKDLKSPSSTRLDAALRHAHGDLTSLAPHERLPEIFSYLEPVCCSMSSSNWCFLTCIQISQEASPPLLQA